MGFNTFPCNPYPISTEELNKGNNDDLNTRVAALESDVSDLNSNKANQITIAPFFSTEASYDPGDLVYYNGLSYRCVNAHEGEWDADDFAATTISGELDTLKSGLTNLKYRKVAESASTGTLGDKLLSLATAFNTLTLAQRRTAFLMRNGVDIFHPINVSGNFFICYIGDNTYIWRYSLNGEAVQSMGGTISDISSASNADVYEIWSCGS